MGVDGGFEFEGEGCAGRDCDGGVGRDGSALVPGLPEGGDSRKGYGRKLFGGAEEKFRQGRGNKDEGDAVEEEREDEIREAVGMSEGDAGEIWRGWVELHGGDDVRGVGGELLAGKSDALRVTGCCGGKFEMGDMWRWSGKIRWRLGCFDRAGDGA